MTPKYVTQLDPSFLSRFKEDKPPFGPVGYVTYARTYARRVDPRCRCTLGRMDDCLADEHRIEKYWETIGRCVEGIARFGAFTKDELETLYEYWFSLKCSGGGRLWWQLGTQTVERTKADSLQNCWFVACRELSAFEFAMNELMLGGGVGFSVRAQHIYKLPPVKHSPEVRKVDTFDCDLIVPDNREGWVELLHRVLDSFFFTGRRLHYNVKCLRGQGEPLQSFGGTASGSLALVEGIEAIVKILSQNVGMQLSSTGCLQIFASIMQVVVAGNVRRSSGLGIGDVNDHEFIEAKRWDLHHVPVVLQNVNNSIVCSSIRTLSDDFWEQYNGEGEPVGLLNIILMQTRGRLVDPPIDDHLAEGTNPCAEATLEHLEACNLGEIFLPNLTDAEFFTAAELMTKVCKTVSSVPHTDPRTQEVVSRNHRIGIGVTGFLQALDKHRPDLFNHVYHRMREVDAEYSKLLGIRESIKLTVVKPSGTLSLLAGCTPGMHPAFGSFYIRRIIFSPLDPLVECCRKAGFWVEPRLNIDGSRSSSQVVVEFPCKTPPGTVLEEEMTAVQQLETQKWLQIYWADNSVSCTIKYWPHEIHQVRAWLEKEYDGSVKTVSFLRRDESSGFKQMPYEAISEAEFHALSKGTRMPEEVSTFGDAEVSECAGSCPTR